MITKKSVLLVEDNNDDAELALRALKEAQVSNRIFRVHDGAEALDYLFGEGAYADRDLADLPTVVLLDLHMPKVDGFEVLKRMRADEKTRLVPVVIFTSSKEQRDVLEGYGLGANSYVPKPIEFAAFANAMRQLSMYWLGLNMPASSSTG